ncbi:glutamate/gamma-aminobutyrate family transporter YjeM [Furfurilactobacillus curtus]|uniref:Glutamate/gamma-aminobutyrate family transporter YjeM n=1 Tax=Furfurilactobacillus curtus TaxID=1746200 RepID=A0ABQ5JRR2_9LACO
MEEEFLEQRNINLTGLVLMVFTAIYGIGNTTVAYDQMGYAAIMWYILAAILFFLPSVLMFAEYGATFKAAHGGIYSWLAESIGERLAFTGTFIWLSGWIVWLVSEGSKIWIPFATAISGHDTTQQWHLLGLNSTETIGILAVLWMVVVTFFSTHGINQIARFAAFGGAISLLITAFFMLTSLLLLLINGGRLAQPVTSMNLIHSPNPQFTSPIALMSFVVYAIFAYGGMETMGGVIDNVKNPEKTFPRAMLISTFLMLFIYSIGIFMWGISANWHSVLGNKSTDLGNVLYVLMNNLGASLGHALHLSSAGATSLGNWFGRLIGIEEFLSDTGAFFVLVYSPLKSFIMGTPDKFWPKRVTRLNRFQVPAFAMWMQALIVCVVILAVAFGGNSAQSFYTVLTDMENISSAFPYLFLVGAFPFFKRRHDLQRPFVVYKKPSITWTVSAITWITVLAGIIFTVIQPMLTHDYYTAFWTIIGPIFFAGIALTFYHHANRNTN